jgi:diguanylate cyclase (GGDEF)-like protein/PAS domain S-box-containing protein
MDTGGEGFLRVAIENANDAVIVFEYDPGEHPFRIRYVNPMFEQQTGYSKEEAIGQLPTLMHGPKTDRASLDRTMNSLLLKLPSVLTTLRYRKDGTTFWAELNSRPLVDGAGNLCGVVAIQRDITERMKAQQRSELLSTAMDQATDAMAIFEWQDGSQWTLAYVNEMFLRLTGYRRDEVIGRTSDFLVGTETNQTQLNDIRTALLSGETVRAEIALYRADGAPFWAEVSARALKNPEGRVVNSIVLYRDVTEKHERERRLSYEATHDSLTGAHNRRSFTSALEEALCDVRERRHTHGLLYYDLDDFKPINDRFGHEAGDQVLIALTRAVGVTLRRVDLLARIGGDEFAVFLRGCPPSRAQEIASDVLDAIAGVVVMWNGQALRVGASIGVVAIDASVMSAADALRRADEACYEAKRAGRNRIAVG